MSLQLGTLGMPALPTISTMTDELIGIGGACNSSGASATYPTANMALLFPVRLAQARTYTKAWWLNGITAAGNIDVGIYTVAGTTATKVVSSTAEAQAGVSAMQVATTFTSTTVGPGIYYLVISASLATATVWRYLSGTSSAMISASGCYQAATQHPLTAASFTVVRSALSTIPVFGFSELSTL